MKKHLVLIMNIVLIAVVIGGVVFVLTRTRSEAPTVAEPTQAATARVETKPPTEAPTEPSTIAERYKVGIVQHSSGPSSNSCYEGFVSQMESRGLLANLDIDYVVEEDDEKCAAELRRLVDEGCDLLYTIGPFASVKASAITDKIPIVFAAVSDPEDIGLVDSNESPGGNITGVSGYTPVFEQIDLIPVILPDTDSVAVVYHSTDESAVRQALIATWEAEEFEYTADRYPVDDADGIADTLEDIKEKGNDVIYLPIDDMMIANMDAICAFAQENSIPVICGNKNMMMMGGLATCEINFTSIGNKSADLAYDILFDKKDPAALPVIYKHDCYNLVNKQKLEELKLKLSANAMENVKLIDADTDTAG